MDMSFNIVEFIENNPITKLSNSSNNKLLDKIKENFTDFEKHLFVSSFYCYLNYDKNKAFIIDLDDIWKWLGFTLKENAKRMLLKHFKLDIDYKNLARQVGGASLDNESMSNNKPEEKWGGHNKKTTMLTIKCFKSLCLKAQTKKASDIHEFYMKLEEILQETIEEETTELKQQLKQKNNIILEIKNDSEKEKMKAVEKAIILQFPVNTECVYFGTIDNTNESNEKLVKFGHTNDLSNRVSHHHKHYNNFNLVNAFRVQNKVEIENLIKSHPKIKPQIRCIQVNEKNKTEIISYNNKNGFTIEKLTKYIRDIIQSKIYSIENFNKLVTRNNILEEENIRLGEKIKELEIANSEKSVELLNLKETLNLNQKIIDTINKENQSIYQNVLLPEDDINKKFIEFVNDSCIIRPDVEEQSVNMEGRFRLWNKVKPTKEMFHALKNYLDTRFKPKRIQGHHGYIGVKLKTIDYKKQCENSDVEIFIFQVCKFSDNGKILNSVLLNEYQKWKLSVNKEITDTDMKELKQYLNSSPYALKATVWTEYGNNEGYYGLSIKENNMKPQYTSSTGKKVYKREVGTNQLLGSWETIVKASEFEGISKAKMSRNIKNKVVLNNSYYSTF
jgi:hypothetical protein